MKQKIFYFSILLIFILICTLVFRLHFNTKKEKSSISTQLIQPKTISTCSNQDIYQLVFQYVNNKENAQISVGASTNTQDVQIQKVSTELLNRYTKIIVELNAPKEVSYFDLTLNINNKNYILKNITHHNYHTKDPIAYSLSGLQENPEYKYEIGTHTHVGLDYKDIRNLSFGLLQETLTDISYKSIHEAELISNAVFPSIIGVYYIENNHTTCIGNTYRSIYLE